MAAAELEAAKNSWQVAITILDSGGNMVMFHKVDNAQLPPITVSEGKARTALEFKRPSKALDDAIAAGGAGMRLLALKDITPLEGGMPVVVDGKIVGAIGVSGALSSQDAQVAKAGADALTKWTTATGAEPCAGCEGDRAAECCFERARRGRIAALRAVNEMHMVALRSATA